MQLTGQGTLVSGDATRADDMKSFCSMIILLELETGKKNVKQGEQNDKKSESNSPNKKGDKKKQHPNDKKTETISPLKDDLQMRKSPEKKKKAQKHGLPENPLMVPAEDACQILMSCFDLVRSGWCIHLGEGTLHCIVQLAKPATESCIATIVKKTGLVIQSLICAADYKPFAPSRHPNNNCGKCRWIKFPESDVKSNPNFKQTYLVDGVNNSWVVYPPPPSPPQQSYRGYQFENHNKAMNTIVAPPRFGMMLAHGETAMKKQNTGDEISVAKLQEQLKEMAAKGKEKDDLIAKLLTEVTADKLLQEQLKEMAAKGKEKDDVIAKLLKEVAVEREKKRIRWEKKRQQKKKAIASQGGSKKDNRKQGSDAGKQNESGGQSNEGSQPKEEGSLGKEQDSSAEISDGDGNQMINEEKKPQQPKPAEQVEEKKDEKNADPTQGVSPKHITVDP